MKTKEELNALKEEVETLNNKLAELTEEELAQVSGGAKIEAPLVIDYGRTPPPTVPPPVGTPLTGAPWCQSLGPCPGTECLLYRLCYPEEE